MIQQQDWNVCPFGYSTADAVARLATLMQEENTILVDIRYSTKSLRKPEWSGQALQERYGNRYLWIRELGNENYFNHGEIKIHDPAQGIPRLMKGIERGYKLIMLCTCSDYSKCHRRTVVEMLCSQMPGVRVMQPDLPSEGGNSYMQREWTEQSGKIPCISIQHPYCMAIMERKKSIELRTWGTSYRGPIAIHAGSTWYGGIKIPGRATNEEMRPIKEFVQRLSLPARAGDYPVGAIVGIARLVQCRRFSSASDYEYLREQHRGSQEWDKRDYGWWLTDVVKLPEPVKTRGYLGMFGVDRAPLEAFLASMEREA